MCLYRSFLHVSVNFNFLTQTENDAWTISFALWPFLAIFKLVSFFEYYGSWFFFRFRDQIVSLGFCARVWGREYFRLVCEYLIINRSCMCLRDQIFRVLSLRALYFWSRAQVTAGLNVLGSLSAFCYTFCKQVITGANVLRIFSGANVAAEAIAMFLLLYFIIDFERKWLQDQWWIRG